MLNFLAPLLSIGGNLMGGIMAQQSAQRGYETAEAGRREELATQNQWRQQDIDLQREFAQNGVRWRVEDSQKAGLHPLAALGMQGATYNATPYQQAGLGQNDFAAAGAEMGQSVARAMDAGRTGIERWQAQSDPTVALGVERMRLENDLLRSQIANSNAALIYQAGHGPSRPNPASRDPLGVPVAMPNAAQQAQDHYGDPLEWVYGAMNWLESHRRQIQRFNNQPAPVRDRQVKDAWAPLVDYAQSGRGAQNDAMKRAYGF